MSRALLSFRDDDLIMCHTDLMATGLRARVRAEMTAEIKAVARRHLAVDGANLSLRAVARDLGLVSSAIYRYFPSRDDLLTALIIDAYNALADAVDAAVALAPPQGAARWRAVADAIRDWARSNRPEYALIYGSPVPGYAAPDDTIGPATRPVLVLLDLLESSEASVSAPPRLSRTTRAEMKAAATALGHPGLSEPVLARAMGVWAELFGLISFELFGQFANTVDDQDAFFAYHVEDMGRRLTLG